VHRKCRGIKAKAEQIIYNLAPWDKKLEQEDNFLSNLQTKGDNSTMVGLVVPRGNPRYVKGIWPT
jgi:hypothetical protein